MRRAGRRSRIPTKGGDFGVDLLIPREGGIATVSHPRTALVPDAFRDCVVGVFSRIDFARPLTGKTTVSYSLRFTPVSPAPAPSKQDPSVPVATRESWQNKPMPEARAALRYERRFTPEERRRLALGIVPRNMEDKWFIFLEDDWLCLHRSWTGACMYAVKLAATPDGGADVTEAWVNRAPDQYTRTDDDYDVKLLAFLVERLLLGHDAPFPVPPAVATPERSALYRHHVVGHERTNDDDE